MTEAWKSIGTTIFEAKDDSTDADIKKLCDGIIATKVMASYNNEGAMQQVIKSWMDRTNNELQVGSNERRTNANELITDWETRKTDKKFLLELVVAILRLPEEGTVVEHTFPEMELSQPFPIPSLADEPR